MTDYSTMSLGRVLAVVAVFALVGTPMVAFLWETLNELMALQVQWWRIAVSIPLLGLLLLWLRVLARTLHRLDGPRVESPHPNPERR